MKNGTPNAADRTANQAAQSPDHAADTSLDIAGQPVVLEPEDEVVKINQGDILEPFVRQNGDKNEERR